MGDGVVQGTTSFARGVGYGVKGIVTKPIDGAQDRGAAGCIQGVFKALVGVVVEPLSGCLDFMALSVSGVGTSCSNCFDFMDHDQKFERYRLPRAIKGDGVLTPYAPYEARGQVWLIFTFVFPQQDSRSMSGLGRFFCYNQLKFEVVQFFSKELKTTYPGV